MTSLVGQHSTEEHDHARALTLAPETVTSAELHALLGHSSWRVRKAALANFERLRSRLDIVPMLIESLGEPENAGLRSACAEGLTRLGEVALPVLVEALHTPDVDRRKFVVEVLGAIGTKEARNSLITAIDDTDDNVRAAVVAALGRLGDADVLAALRAKLAERVGAPQAVAYVLGALAELKASLTYSELEPLLERPELVRLTFPLLGRCADARARTRLVAAIEHGKRGARLDAVRALAEQRRQTDVAVEAELRQLLLAAPGAVKTLDEALADTDDCVAEAALVLLGLLADPNRAPRLLATASTRPFVRSAVEVVRPLGFLAVAPLLNALDTASTEARVLFLEFIESYGDADAVPKLLGVAAGIESRAAEAAISALGKIGDTSCIEPLIAIARDGEPDIVRQVALALAAIGMRKPADVANRLRSVLADGDVRAVWIVVLGLIGRDEDMTTIVSASRHRDAEVRRAAVDAFGAYGARIDEEAVILGLADEHAGVRAAAARALGAYRGERVVDALLVCTRDASSAVVAEALRSLGSVGGPKAAMTLLDAASGSSAPEAIAALQSLFRLRPPGLSAAVARALQHADPEVVREGLVLTMRLGVDEARALVLPCLEHRSWHVRLAAVEMLTNRDLGVAEDVVLTRLDQESEPLVREALARMTGMRGGFR